MIIPALKLTLIALVLTIGLPVYLHAQNANESASDAQQAAYHSSLVQEGLQRDSSKLQAQLKTLLIDMQTNGVKVEGADDLVDACSHLSDLSQQQMQQVIIQLQQASLAANDPDRQKSMLSAYQGQKDLALQLKNMADQLSAEEAQNTIPLQLMHLIKRQSANLRMTTNLQNAPANTDQSSLRAVITTEQSSLGDEIAMLVRRFAKQTTPPPDAPALNEAAAQAAQLTKQGVLDQAFARQTSVKQYLVSILAAIEAKKDVAERLAEAQEQLEQMEADEKQVQNATSQSNADNNQLKDRQAKIADQAAATASLLSQLNMPAANQLSQAQQAMEKSLADLNNAQNRDPAKADQSSAIQALDKANELLAKQIAQAQSQDSETPEQQLADLEKLKAEVDQEQQGAANGDAQQAAQNMQQTQQEASTQVPEASSLIGAAATAMQQPQTDRTQASSLLGQASSTIQSKIDQVKADAQAYAALDQMQQQLTQAQQNAANAQGLLNANDPSQMNNAAQNLNAAQQLASQASQGTTQTPAEAMKAMKEAIEALKNAGISTVKADAQGAKQQNAKGMQSLANAQQSLAQAMASIAVSMNKKAGKGDKGSGSHSISQMELNAKNHSRAAGDTGDVVGTLNPVDRQAIVEYQAEKVVPDYASQIHQYMKNLADTSASSTTASP